MSLILPEEWTANLTPSIGKVSAPIKIVFFVDYQCPSCRKNDPLVRQAISKKPNIALIYREFPLPKLHPLSTDAAIIAENARQNGTFALAHKRLMEGKTLDITSLREAARSAKVSTKASAQTSNRLAMDHAITLKGNLKSVPSFILIENGKSTLLSPTEMLAYLNK